VLLLIVLKAIYVDTVEEKRIVAIKSKLAFRPLLEIRTLKPECASSWWLSQDSASKRLTQKLRVSRGDVGS